MTMSRPAMAQDVTEFLDALLEMWLTIAELAVPENTGYRGLHRSLTSNLSGPSRSGFGPEALNRTAQDWDDTNSLAREPAGAVPGSHWVYGTIKLRANSGGRHRLYPLRRCRTSQNLIGD